MVERFLRRRALADPGRAPCRRKRALVSRRSTRRRVCSTKAIARLIVNRSVASYGSAGTRTTSLGSLGLSKGGWKDTADSFKMIQASSTVEPGYNELSTAATSGLPLVPRVRKRNFHPHRECRLNHHRPCGADGLTIPADKDEYGRSTNRRCANTPSARKLSRAWRRASGQSISRIQRPPARAVSGPKMREDVFDAVFALRNQPDGGRADPNPNTTRMPGNPSVNIPTMTGRATASNAETGAAMLILPCAMAVYNSIKPTVPSAPARIDNTMELKSGMGCGVVNTTANKSTSPTASP